jgi:hypothetical protein
MGVFAEWQPRYAERGIPTFPVREKIPAIANYLKIGTQISATLASKFTNDDGFGFACRKANITVLDVDDPDEGLFEEALREFGPTPILIKTGSGNHQAWYRNSGEGRRIRPEEGRPIDILGDGYVVAPPSKTSKGTYGFLRGSLDDLARLPPLRVKPPQRALIVGNSRIETGERNKRLFEACMRRAAALATFDQLHAFAVQMNGIDYREPQSEAEVTRVAKSAWKMTQEDRNWFAQGKIVTFSFDEVDELLSSSPDGLILLMRLRRCHWGANIFVIANAMANTMPGGGWTRKRFAAARTFLERCGSIEMVRAASRQNGPALYRFKGGQF